MWQRCPSPSKMSSVTTNLIAQCHYYDECNRYWLPDSVLDHFAFSQRDRKSNNKTECESLMCALVGFLETCRVLILQGGWCASRMGVCSHEDQPLHYQAERNTSLLRMGTNATGFRATCLAIPDIKPLHSA
jgi:hypothetical protein